MLNARLVDGDWFVVIEDDRCLQMACPCGLFIHVHLHRRSIGSKAIESGYDQHHNSTTYDLHCTHFCISPAVPLTPRHNKNRIVANVTDTTTLPCDTNFHIARVGGRFAFADFHVTPPFGRIILSAPPPIVVSSCGCCCFSPPAPRLYNGDDEPFRLANGNQPLPPVVGLDVWEMLRRRMMGNR